MGKHEKRGRRLRVKVYDLSVSQDRASKTGKITSTAWGTWMEIGSYHHRLRFCSSEDKVGVWNDMGYSGPPDQICSFRSLKNRMFHGKASYSVCEGDSVTTRHADFDSIKQGYSFRQPILGEFTSGFGHQAKFQYSLSPLIRWTVWTHNSNFRGHVKSLCVGFWRILGWLSAFSRVRLQQQLLGDNQNASLWSVVW